MKKHELTCLPRLDMNPVADNSFILASMRGYLESNDKMEKQYSFSNRKYDSIHDLAKDDTINTI